LALVSDIDGSFIAQSPLLGQEIYQWCAAGDELYAATATFTTTTPVVYSSSKIQRVTRTSMGSVAATYTAPVLGDLWGVASDGTSIWATERTSGNLRKLNASSLASITTYALNAGITALQYVSGDLWVLSADTNEVVKWHIASTAETLRFSVAAQPCDLIVVGSLVFVLAATGIYVYNSSTGALVTSTTVTPASLLPQRGMCLYDTYVVTLDLTGASRDFVLLDASTGAYVRRIASGHPYLFTASGQRGTALLGTIGSPGSSADTRAYTPQAAALSGYSLTVYQIGAAGRGYPATLEL
jgi:hypothetical protein